MRSDAVPKGRCPSAFSTSGARMGELDALRARAYGPDADIFDDPDAMRRLEELEALHRLPPRPVTPAPEAAMDATAGSASDAPVPPHPAEPKEQTEATESSAGEPTPPSDPEAAPTLAARRWWRRPRVLWVASLVAAVTVTAVVTAFIASSAPRPIAVLEGSAADWPEQLYGDRSEGGRMFADFYGITVVSLPQQFEEGAPAPCLYILRTGDLANGMLGGGCGAGAFSATAAIAVSSTMPKRLRDHFPEGSAIQFVFDGTRVLVYADRAPAAATLEP
jgi:hypothetical protein